MASRTLIIGGWQTATVAKRNSLSTVYWAAAASYDPGVMMISESLISKSLMCWSSDVKTDCNALDSDAHHDK